MEKYVQLEKPEPNQDPKPVRNPIQVDDPFVCCCTVISTCCTLALLICILLVLFLSYYPTVRQNHIATCDVLNCTVTPRECGISCNIFNDCSPKVCLDTLYNLHLVGTNYTVSRSQSITIVTNEPTIYLNRTYNCSYTNGWTNSSACYYNDNNILPTLTIYLPILSKVGSAQIFIIVLMSIAAFVGFVFSVFFIIANINNIKNCYRSIKHNTV
jgi:hypothetical protein